ncbi:MAG: CYTH domain-containing protein [Micavibrio sp.]
MAEEQERSVSTIMGSETEYRFLLRRKPPLAGITPDHIQQGYLSTDPDRVVRVRQRGEHAYLTIKGRKTGATAAEFEYAIPVEDVAALLILCGDACLTKERYRVPGPDGKIWDVDIFTGRHQGLMIAEIEVAAEGEEFARPGWLDGMDVTTDPCFGNANLALLSEGELEKLLSFYRV